MIAEILENHGTLEPGDFHSQWRLDYNPEATIKEEHEFDLPDEIARLHLLLSHEPVGQLPQIFKQFHQIISSTHVAAKVQQPAVKTETKGRPSHKKGAGDSTKRDPSAHEHVEAEVEKAGKKRPIEPLVNSRKRVKRSGGVDNEEEEKAEDEKNKNNKPTQEGVDNEEEGKGEDKKKKDKKPTQEVGKTTIKLRLHKKPIQQETEEKNEPMKEDNSIKSPYHLEIPPIFKNYVRALFNPEG
ncbi:hypothetical protein Pst134EB_014513 [Puccinia striiformis f. sp. tritici]|nr:hypothetical protein Pst134EB_014513 [Puccinia striiformis f. sp. tritici]